MIPVILNPNAKSARASRLSEAIQALSPRIKLWETENAGDARRMARELAAAGAPLVVAAGGDGTINEAVNGLADAGPSCHTALGVLPAGTMNVFSTELGLPQGRLAECWQIIEHGVRKEVDLWRANDHYFVQLAGVGLDAEIIRETTWERKKAMGPLGYVVSAAQLLGRQAPPMVVHSEGRGPVTGSVVLIGNGKHYGGPFRIFPQACNADGMLDVLVFRKNGYAELFTALLSLLTSGFRDGGRDIHYFQARALRVESEHDVPFEADGDLISSGGPVEFSLAPWKLKVMSRA